MAAGGVVVMMPSAAYAHGKIEGVGDLFNGLAHPLRVPSHLLLLVALSLLLAQQKPRRLTWPMAVFTACSGLAIGVAGALDLAGISPLIPLGLLMGLAALVVWGRPMGLPMRAAVCALVAIVAGLDSPPEGESLLVSLKFGVGSWLCLSVVVVDLAFYASLVQAEWVALGRRVMGAWVLAIAILMLAFYAKSVM